MFDKKEWYQKDMVLRQNRQKYLLNINNRRDKCLEYSRKKRQNPEYRKFMKKYLKSYGKKNKDKIRKKRLQNPKFKEWEKEYNKNYRKKHKGKLKSYFKEHYQKNKKDVARKHKEYYTKNKVKEDKRNREYAKKHPEIIKKSAKKYCETHKEECKQRNKDWVNNNRDKYNKRAVRYYWNNPEKCRLRGRIYAKNNRKKITKYRKEKYLIDIEYRLLEILRGRIYRVLKRNKKSDVTRELVGCSLDKLKRHLEKQFTFGMNWKNYGYGWHLDHIKPCASFDLSKPEEQQKCFHYSNLQPLWALENIKKGNKFLSV